MITILINTAMVLAMPIRFSPMSPIFRAAT